MYTNSYTSKMPKLTISNFLNKIYKSLPFYPCRGLLKLNFKLIKFFDHFSLENCFLLL